MPLLPRCLRIISYIGLIVPAGAAAQGARTAEDSVRSVARIDQLLVRHAVLLEREVWPGYRYDSLGLLYMVPRVGKLAVRWPGEPPTGMRPLPGVERSWWAETQAVRWQGGLPVGYAQVSGSRGQLIALALHEAFHAHEAKSKRAGARFGAGENALLTAQYPVFDVMNESMFAVEASLLARALRASSDAEARRLASEFLAVRRERHARLKPRFVEYEQLAEQHEGLAQYVYHRGLAVMATVDASLAPEVRAELAAETSVLDSTLKTGPLSVRRRFYATGAHMGLLLDRLSGSWWKQRLVSEDAWLQDLLARAVGRSVVSDIVRADVRAAMTEAVRGIEALRQRRAQQRDSVLSLPGTRVRLSLPEADWCMFDPQNLLLTGRGEQLHMRTVSLCVGGRTIASLEVPSVEDPFTRTVQFVSPGALVLRVGDRTITLPAAGETVTVENAVLHADGVEVRGGTVVLVARGSGELAVTVVRP